MWDHLEEGRYQLRTPPFAPTPYAPILRSVTSPPHSHQDGIRSIAATKARLEEGQYHLLTLLVGQPAAGGDEGDDALVAFVRCGEGVGKGSHLCAHTLLNIPQVMEPPCAVHECRYLNVYCSEDPRGWGIHTCISTPCCS